MPLEPYLRGSTWWAKGRIEYNGRPITGYLRESTGASDKAGARDWIRDREEREIRSHVVGEEHVFTFADAVMMYQGGKDMAKHLKPIVAEIGAKPVRQITPQMVRQLGAKLYPENSTDTWRRWVVTPVRAVINNAHDMHPDRCGPIRIKGYTTEERVEQDKKRGKKSRVRKTPGDWAWLLKFRTKANKRNAALALLMFTTGARVGQAVAMTPQHLKLADGKVIIPGAKGHDDREVTIPPELVAELRQLGPRVPRGWERKPKNLRVFGYASKDGPRKNWMKACKDAGIPYLPPHSAGRHGFGQEMRVRRGIDAKAVENAGGWSPSGNMVDRTYTHAEDASGKILKALRTGRVQAEKKTGLKLAEKVGK